ncbi:hypothetical protein ACFE04_020998 [Oxalis oulophora]
MDLPNWLELQPFELFQQPIQQPIQQPEEMEDTRTPEEMQSPSSPTYSNMVNGLWRSIQQAVQLQTATQQNVQLQTTTQQDVQLQTATQKDVQLQTETVSSANATVGEGASDASVAGPPRSLGKKMLRGLASFGKMLKGFLKLDMCEKEVEEEELEEGEEEY